MTVIRTSRFTADPAEIDVLLRRRRDLLDAVRARFAGPSETRLVRLDERTWLDMWSWDSEETLRSALEAAPRLPEAVAAFQVAHDATAEHGELVDQDVWTR